MDLSFFSKKSLFLAEKMLRLLEIFLRKNSSPFFSKLVRVRDSNVYILLVVTTKPCNFYSWHFLLRPLLSEIFAGPFHRAKMIEQGETVCSEGFCQEYWRLRHYAEPILIKGRGGILQYTISSLHISVFPLEARSFEEKQIFQEEQKTICAIIKPVLGIFF